jgi:hypothetical protein
MQSPRNLKVRLVTILVVLSPLLFTTFMLHSHNWDPLRAALMLSPGRYQSPEFATDLDGTYVVSLVFDEMPDTNREDCLIGEELANGSCKSLSPTLNFNWTIIGDDGSIQNRGHFKVHGITGAKNEVEAMLGTFEAKRGGHQKIVLSILSDAGELNTAHPRLKVEAHRVYWEKWVIFDQMALLFALAVGLVWIVIILWHKLIASLARLPKASEGFLVLTLLAMTACAYTAMQWFQLDEFANMFGLPQSAPIASQELVAQSQNWGIAALVLGSLAFVLSLLPVRKQPKHWFVRAAFCILGTFGLAVLFYFFHEV